MIRTRLLVPGGASDQLNGGEMSAPSQVYSAGTWPPGANAGLASIKAMTFPSIDLRHNLPAPLHERRDLLRETAMGDTLLRSGMLVFPNLTQLDLTGPYEVLARLPGAETRLLWKNLDPVRSEHGLAILPDTTLADCPPLNLVLVPGGAGINPLLEDADVLAF